MTISSAPRKTKIEFWVAGVPATQGSMKHIGNGRVIHGNAKKLRAWREAIAVVAFKHRINTRRIASHVSIELDFRFKRPRSHYTASGKVRGGKTAPPAFPPPDLDKLVRAVKDALSGVLIIDDRLVSSIVASKSYDTAQSGVWITLRPETPKSYD